MTDHHQTDATMPPWRLLFSIRTVEIDAILHWRGSARQDCIQSGVVSLSATIRIRRSRAGPCLDLVALATVADIVPLQDENRILVRAGLHQLNRGARCGIRAQQVAGHTKVCTQRNDRIFVLGPRLNAAGSPGSCDALRNR